MFVRNAWYVGAWDHEIGRDMLRRIILNEPVVFFRRDDGRPVALEDRCCHRQAPLSRGKLVGNIVECGYHGLQFDTSGACIKIPSQDRIPPSAKVKAFPVIEKNHWVWIWLGDPAKADPALIEDFHWMDDPEWRFGGSSLHVEANYLLLVENLLDTTHLPFLHPESLGTDEFARSEFEVTREGDRSRGTEGRITQDFQKYVRVDAAFAHQRERLAQALDHRGEEKVARDFYRIRLRGFVPNDEHLFS